MKHKPEDACVGAAAELMYFGIIVRSHQVNGIRLQDMIFIPERDPKEHLIFIL